jgi:antitoxin PrlF
VFAITIEALDRREPSEMSALARLNSKGQLTIPREILDDLNVVPGTEFTITVQDGSVLVTPATMPVSKTMRLMDFAGILGTPPNGESFRMHDLNEALLDIAVEEDERVRREWRESQK